MYRYTPSFVISSSYRKIFFIGYITKALSSVYYDEKVGDVKGSIDEVIKERISSLNEDNNPLLIFPEETSSSGNHILNFNNLAFKPLSSIKPLMVKSQDPCFSISQTPLGLVMHFILSQCFLYQNFTIFTYPIINPTNYLYERMGSQNKEKYEVYKEAVRNIYCSIGQLKPSDKTQKDRDKYLSLFY